MAKVTIQDVARVAGVSVATVDRVLNRRPGVRSVTVNKVEGAIRDLNYQPDRIAARLARSREYRFCFVLPDRAGDFWERINEEVRIMADRMAGERVAISVKRVDVFDGELLATAAEVSPIGTEDYPTPARRPSYSLLECRATRRELGLPALHWRDALAQVQHVLHDTPDAAAEVAGKTEQDALIAYLQGLGIASRNWER